MASVRAAVAALLLLACGCDHGLPEEPAGVTGIAGTVRFHGSWSPEVAEVAVAVYQEHPRTLADFYSLVGADQGVPVGATSYRYFVSVDGDAVYSWVIVAWRRHDQFWDFTSLLGCYYQPGDTLPRAVAVRRGEVADHTDIDVDLGVLAGETPADLAVCESALPADLLASVRDGD